MWVPPASLDHGYDVCGANTSRTRTESTRASVPVLHRPLEGIRLRRPYPPLGGILSLRFASEDNSSNPPIPRWDESLRTERERQLFRGVRCGAGITPRVCSIPLVV